MKSKYLRIGLIVRAHGVRGDVKLVPLTDDTGRYRQLHDGFIESRGQFLPVAVSDIRTQPDAALLHISGVDTPEEAEKLRGAYLCVDRAHAVKLPEGAYFVADLIGCEVTDSDGNAYGKLTDVLETGANDVYEIAGGALMVPALKRVLHSVDVENGAIVLDAAVLKEVGLFAD